VHDVVGHALGVISAEAGVTRGLADASEQELRDTLADIENHARSALEDIQSLVRSLRTAPGVEPGRADMAAPVPGISQLPSLVAAARAAGVRVEARVAAPEQVDEVVAAVAFRSVQEALSNVVRHAPGTSCTVEVHVDDDVLVVRVRDDGPGKEDGVSGFGLRGMRERAHLAGGTVTWRNLPDRGFEVEARLPLGGSR
jgi:signal transduction histidine kinase